MPSLLTPITQPSPLPVLVWRDPSAPEFIAARSLKEARTGLIRYASYTPAQAAAWQGVVVDTASLPFQRDDGSTVSMAVELAEQVAAGAEPPFWFAGDWAE